jgi:hypothetical protein
VKQAAGQTRALEVIVAHVRPPMARSREGSGIASASSSARGEERVVVFRDAREERHFRYGRKKTTFKGASPLFAQGVMSACVEIAA